jgi:Kae1-associated kinase Bud32
MQNKNTFFKKGAEAELMEITIDGKDCLSKKRIPKNYRDKKLDLQIRKKRTRAEAKILSEVSFAVNVPRIIQVDETNAEIIMEYINGVPLKEIIQKKPSLCEEAGRCIRKIHNLGIIHGDLTTSNIIFLGKSKGKELSERIKKKGALFFVDFGLGFYSSKVEDKATDLVVFKKTFNATHSSIKGGFAKVLKGYNPDEEMKIRMEAIEKRARYH